LLTNKQLASHCAAALPVAQDDHFRYPQFHFCYPLKQLPFVLQMPATPTMLPFTARHDLQRRAESDSGTELPLEQSAERVLLRAEESLGEDSCIRLAFEKQEMPV
jgi:hypothetical protein